MGKTKAQNGAQTASYCNNTLRRTTSKQLHIQVMRLSLASVAVFLEAISSLIYNFVIFLRETVVRVTGGMKVKADRDEVRHSELNRNQVDTATVLERLWVIIAKK